MSRSTTTKNGRASAMVVMVDENSSARELNDLVDKETFIRVAAFHMAYWRHDPWCFQDWASLVIVWFFQSCYVNSCVNQDGNQNHI
jgi:hypothetical protein